MRGGEFVDDLLFTKLDQEGIASTLKVDHLLPCTKALQRRIERAEEIEAVITARQGGTRTVNFLLRPGASREFLGKALSTCTGHAASPMLKAISNTLLTKEILHKWFLAEYTKATCGVCGKEDSTISNFALNCSKLKDATTAAHDKAFEAFLKRWKIKPV